MRSSTKNPNHILCVGTPMCNTTKGLDIMEFSSWKRFLMLSMLQFVVQRKRALRSSWIFNECNLSCKIVKNCRIISLNRAKKNKFCPRSVWKKKERLIVRFNSDVMKKYLKGWFTRHQICRQELLVT